MNKLKTHTFFLCILLLVTALCSISGAELNSERAISRMCGAASAFPDDEVSVSLPAEFFSLYEAKQGYFYSPESNTLPKEVGDAFVYKEQHEPFGRLVMALDRLEYDSPYVYKADGVVKVSVNGAEQILSMDKIDYVCSSEDNELCYRLTCTPESGVGRIIDKVYVLCYSCREGQSVLVGSISYMSQKGELEVAYPFLITGRNEFEAERHLQKKIAIATVY
ncbi:MAG: hypothetical protein A2Y31_12865 [Spirochaetes bacterium GWC2_52_13]|nr:MAG: hypothetical protein A2Y31_12865 [Spirochaetes bacterium GWC2_52_13]